MAQTIDMENANCNPTETSTDPDNYSNPADPNSEDRWDWRQEEFTIYLQGEGGTQGTDVVTIVSPYFDQQGNPNVFDLADAQNKDFEPEDGWELLYRNFGTPQQGTTTPFFVLYNKYTGTIRAFVNIINSGESPYTAAAMKLTFENPGFSPTRQTAVLNQVGSSTFAGDEIQRDAGRFKLDGVIEMVLDADPTGSRCLPSNGQLCEG
jgi:hypothetical protein